jgi:hypothetical protein
LGKTKKDFRFFLAFAGKVMDRYGRLLAYLHPDQQNGHQDHDRAAHPDRLVAVRVIR